MHTRGNECERTEEGTEKCKSVPCEYSLEKQSFLRAHEQEASWCSQTGNTSTSRTAVQSNNCLQEWASQCWFPHISLRIQCTTLSSPVNNPDSSSQVLHAMIVPFLLGHSHCEFYVENHPSQIFFLMFSPCMKNYISAPLAAHFNSAWRMCLSFLVTPHSWLSLNRNPEVSKSCDSHEQLRLSSTTHQQFTLLSVILKTREMKKWNPGDTNLHIRIFQNMKSKTYEVFIIWR